MSQLVERVARALAADDSEKLAVLWDEADSAAAEGMRDNYRRKARVVLAAIGEHNKGLCGHMSPLNYDHSRWATCRLEAGHSGDHREADLMWGSGFMPSKIPPTAAAEPEGPTT